MLVLGDPVDQLYFSDDTEIENIEVIYTEDEFLEVIETFNLKGHNYEIEADVIRVYKPTSLKTIVLYDATDMEPFSNIIEHHFAHPKHVRLGTPNLNFAFYRSKITYNYIDPVQWYIDVNKYNHYRNEILKKTNIHIYRQAINNSKTWNVIMRHHPMLDHKKNEDITSEYSLDLQYSLYEEFTKYPRSKYLEVTDNLQKDPDKNIWSRLNETEKLFTILELLYVNASLNYIIPQVKDGNLNLKDTPYILIEAMMRICAKNKLEEGENFISYYIKSNIIKILKVADKGFDRNLLKSISNNQINIG